VPLSTAPDARGLVAEAVRSRHYQVSNDLPRTRASGFARKSASACIR
jgi:hypothetical protein